MPTRSYRPTAVGWTPGGTGARTRLIAVIAVGAVGVLGGVLTARGHSTTYLLCVALAAPVALAMLGDRGFPWAVMTVAVLPWYPLVSEAAEPPAVRQKVLCAAIAAAVLLPWLWSLAFGGRRTVRSRGALLTGVSYLGLTILVYSTVGGVAGMIESKIVGFLFIGVTFLCARRFGRGEGWTAAAFGALVLLVIEGVAAYRQAPAARVGSFVGYPITYGALLVGLLPLALVFAYRRSRLLAAASALGAGWMMILSQSRSSWVAIAVIVAVLVGLQLRAGNLGALTALIASAALVAVLVLSTSGLRSIVEKRLSSNLTHSQSYTHRDWSYNFALGKIGQAPVFGAGVIGYSAEESDRRTSIGAIDNGYLSITVDIGLFGLLAAAIPIAVAITALARCVRFKVIPPRESAMALGIVGIAVVTIFYDSFYWAQIDLLLGALGGALSVSMAAIAPAGTGTARDRARPRTVSRLRWAS